MAKSSELAAYSRMLHDRLYSGWTQPTTTVSSTAKISTVVRVRIENDGTISSFEISKPSGNVMIDDSVAAIGKRVTKVDPLPAAMRSSGHYDVKINFELNSE
jgi:TonB family protein